MTTPSSTLDGWLPERGALVWRQMYDPQRPNHTSTIEERIAAGAPKYGRRELQRVHGVFLDVYSPGVHTFALSDPDRREPASWPDSDWCVLEDAHEVEGALF